jgi:hypothetical protein
MFVQMKTSSPLFRFLCSFRMGVINGLPHCWPRIGRMTMAKDSYQVLWLSSSIGFAGALVVYVSSLLCFLSHGASSLPTFKDEVLVS